MNELILLSSFGIGVVAGLRSMTAPALVALAVYSGWLAPVGRASSYFESLPVVMTLSAWALFELVIDKHPKIGNRTGPLGLSFRIVTSSVSGALLAGGSGASISIGMIVGLAGGLGGTFGGYHLRKIVSQRGSIGDFRVALIEDILAIGLGLICVSVV